MGRQEVAVSPVHVAVAAASLALVPVARADAGSACPDSTLRPTTRNLARVEQALVCELNVERVKAGRVPLTRDARLDRSALRHTRAMARHSFFAHQRRGEPSLVRRIREAGYFKGARSGLYSENLGYAVPERANAASMTHAFSLSESHRHTMLYGRFRNVGIGAVFVDPNPAFYPDYRAVLYTFDFGRRYERYRHHCRRRAASAPGTGRAVRPRRWCHRRSAA